MFEEMLAYMFGALETTTSTLSSFLYRMKKVLAVVLIVFQHPDVERKVKQELNDVLFDGGKLTLHHLEEAFTMEKIA